VAKASEDARHIAYQLHPSVLDDLGLVVSLQAVCEEFSKREGISVKFTSARLPDALPREAASCLYRVSQEALSNIARHSHAKHVSVALAAEKDGVVLSIEDDGAGFDPQRAKGRGGLGLVSMEERARLVDGKLTIGSKPGKGTRIALRIPAIPSKTL
jgi:signal transduction histidine kinase